MWHNLLRLEGLFMPHWLSVVLFHPVTLLSFGGAAGTNARYWLGIWITRHRWTEHFPLATLLINISGSVLGGIAVVLFLERLPAAYRGWYLLLGAGFCGGYTTFSTFSFESYNLIRKGEWRLAVVYALSSVVAGLVAAGLAVVAAEKVIPKQ
jgi:CrcB protein